MPDQNRSAAPARRLAAVLSLFALAAFGLNPAGASTRTPFQWMKTMNCYPGQCIVTLAQLAPNQALDVAHVWCEIEVETRVRFAHVLVDAPGASFFSVPLDVGWERVDGAIRRYNLEVDPDLRVGAGGSLKVRIFYAGGVQSASCAFTGFRITG